MPFKAGHSPTDVSKRLQKILTTDLQKDTEAGLFAIYATLSATADYYVPVDTSDLVQSRTSRIRKQGSDWVMTYGYYSDYAAALHERTDWNPKPPNTPGKKGGGYNPNARPDWLNLAWQESGDEAMSIFARIIEP